MCWDIWFFLDKGTSLEPKFIPIFERFKVGASKGDVFDSTGSVLGLHFFGPWTNFTHGELHIQAEIEVAGRQKKPDVEHQVPVFVLGECLFWSLGWLRFSFFTFATTPRFFPPRKRKLIWLTYRFLNFSGCSCLISAEELIDVSHPETLKELAGSMEQWHCCLCQRTETFCLAKCSATAPSAADTTFLGLDSGLGSGKL